MAIARIVLALALVILVALPAWLPFLELLQEPEGWRVWWEVDRLASLAFNTAKLLGGITALALGLGVPIAVLLYRSDLPGRQWLRMFALTSLFVPLPLLVTSWQAALGTTGWLPVAWWAKPLPADPDLSSQGMLLKPWAYGLGPAIWVHALAGLPWVILLVGQALVWVERELEEDMLTMVGPWRVLWNVTLPRCRVAIAAAALWVALQAMNEIIITDMMQVRTFAEEVYTQLVAGSAASIAGAVAVSLPATLLACGAVLWMTRHWERNLPPLESVSPTFCLIRLGRVRWIVCLLMAGFLGILAGIPTGSLIWKAGQSGTPSAWSAAVTVHHLAAVVHTQGGMVLQSLGVAAMAGAVAAAVGITTCWLARGSPWFHALALGIMATVWASSGPIIGLGLTEAIEKILPVAPQWLGGALYYWRSPVPIVWVEFIRYLPAAIAILWPMVRLIPRELLDAARVDGASAWGEFIHIAIPLSIRPCAWAALAVAILGLGEVSAGKIVATPGWKNFSHEVFTQMHYGVSNDLAAMCLLLLGLVVAGGLAALIFSKAAENIVPR